MKIKSMTAVFGGLEGERLEPGPGLTLITAPNERGKSTWAAFWRSMLYGIDTRSRDRRTRLADKRRFQPWSGRPMEGELELEWQGRDITLRRGPRGNVPFGSFSAVYTGTREPVPELTPTACGELLTGVGAEVFTRSAFLGAGDLAVTAAPELERRIAALVSSGEEDVSFSQAQERLKEWRNRRRVNRSVGEIPRLEGELAQAEARLNQMDEVTRQLARLAEERAELERRQEFLLQRQQAHRRYAAWELSSRYAQAREEYEEARDQLAALEGEQARFGVLPDREALKEAQGELQYLKVLGEEIRQGEEALKQAEERSVQAQAAAQDDLFSQLSGEEAVARTGEECETFRQELQRAERLKKRFLPLQLAGLAALAALAGFAFGLERNIPLLLAAGAGIYLVCAAASLLSLSQGKRAQEQAKELLVRYGVDTPEELAALAQDYQERCRQAERTEHEVQVIRDAVAQRRDRQEATRTGLLDFVHRFAPEVRDMFGCSAALSRSLGLEHELTVARERAEGRKQRLEDLTAQGAGEGELPLEKPGPPEGSLEETNRALALVRRELERVNTQHSQGMGLQQAIGDPAALAARCEELERRLARCQLEHAALELASEVLTQANVRLGERFSPKLNQITSHYMSRLTGGRYIGVSLSRELEGEVQSSSDALSRSARYLSRGAADQLYFALRLSVCQLCLPQKPPVFLDDALASFDDERLARALELLLELAREQQILLFTCQGRESRLLKGVPGVTQITL